MRARLIEPITLHFCDNKTKIIPLGTEFDITYLHENTSGCAGLEYITSIYNHEFELITTPIIQLIDIDTGRIFIPIWIDPIKKTFIEYKNKLNSCYQPMESSTPYGENSSYQEYNSELKSKELDAMTLRVEIKALSESLKRMKIKLGKLYGVNLVQTH